MRRWKLAAFLILLILVALAAQGCVAEFLILTSAVLSGL